METKSNIYDLIKFCQDKSDFLRKLYDVTKLQALDISSNSLNSLLDHIKEKQDIMNEIDAIDEGFFSKFQELKRNLGVNSLDEIDTSEYPEIAELKYSVKEVMDLLGEIDRQDKSNISKAKTEMDKLKEDMKDLKTQTKVFKNYGNSSVSSYGKDYQGFYIDGKK